MGLAEKIAQLKAARNCCHYRANWADQPAFNGWIKTYCRVCRKWLGNRLEDRRKRQ